MNQPQMESNTLQAMSYGLSCLVAEIAMNIYSDTVTSPPDWEEWQDSSNARSNFARKIQRMLAGSGIPEDEWPELLRHATLYERIVKDKDDGYIASYLCSATEPGVILLVPAVPDSKWDTDTMYDERDDESKFYAAQKRPHYPEMYRMEFRKMTVEEFCEQYGVELDFVQKEEPAAAPRM